VSVDNSTARRNDLPINRKDDRYIQEIIFEDIFAPVAAPTPTRTKKSRNPKNIAPSPTIFLNLESFAVLDGKRHLGHSAKRIN